MNVRIALLAGLASFAVACSGNAPTEQEEETDEGALVAGEVESKRYASDVTSVDSTVSGVDVWDYSLVNKDGASYFVASGYRLASGKTRVPALDIVSTGSNVWFRSPKANEPVVLTPERLAAMTTDFAALHARVERSVSTGTQSLRPLSATGKDCAKSLGITLIAGTVAALTAAAASGLAALPACAVSQVLTLGASSLVCVPLAAVTGITAVAAISLTSMATWGTGMVCAEAAGSALSR